MFRCTLETIIVCLYFTFLPSGRSSFKNWTMPESPTNDIPDEEMKTAKICNQVKH